MSNQKRKEYQDEELVLALAAGDRSHAQIAHDLGLSRGMVAAIARGERRPMLQERIEAATAAFRERGGRLAARMAAPAMGRLVQMISPDSDAPAEVQRRAAADILKFAFSGTGRLRPRVGYGEYGWDGPPGPMLSALPAELRERVLDELGAPPDDPEDDEEPRDA